MADWDYDEVCEHLRPVVELELRLGNAIKRVDAPAGSRCPLAIALVNALHREEIERTLHPHAPACWRESRDTHYEVDGTAGYVCEDERHFVFGPLPGAW